MSIEDLLAELDIEVMRATVENSAPMVFMEQRSFKIMIGQINDCYDLLKAKAREVDSTWNIIKKTEMKRELSVLLKQFKQINIQDGLRFMRVTETLVKYLDRYKIKRPANIEADELNMFGNSRAVHAKGRTYEPDIGERIEKNYQKIMEKKKISGVEKEHSTASLFTAEIRELYNAQIRAEGEQRRRESEEKAEKERSLRLAELIEKKHIERKSKQLSFEQNQRKGGLAARRISAARNSFQDIKENQTIEVRYELQNNVYYADGRVAIRPSCKLVTPEEKEMYLRTALKSDTAFNYVFEKYNRKERNAYKYCDPYIVGILANKDLRLAKDYVKQMCGSKDEPVAPGKYNVIYDARGMENINNNEMSRREKSGIRKIIKHIKGATTILQDKRKLPWYASIPVVGALAAATISGSVIALNQANDDQGKEFKTGDSYSDNLQGSSTSVAASQTTPQYTTAFDYETTSTTTTAATTTSRSETTTTSRSATTTTQTTTDYEEQNTTTTTTEKQEPVVVNIGDKISVQEGLKYTADCLGGGNSNKIGAVSWRPAADYCVDRVAFVYQGKVLDIMNAGDCNVKETLNNIAEKNGIDTSEINTSVLLSLVPGVGDTGWAQISIEDMEQNVSKVTEQPTTAYARVNMDFER